MLKKILIMSLKVFSLRLLYSTGHQPAVDCRWKLVRMAKSAAVFINISYKNCVGYTFRLAVTGRKMARLIASNVCNTPGRTSKCRDDEECRRITILRLDPFGFCSKLRKFAYAKCLFRRINPNDPLVPVFLCVYSIVFA